MSRKNAVIKGIAGAGTIAAGGAILESSDLMVVKEVQAAEQQQYDIQQTALDGKQDTLTQYEVGAAAAYADATDQQTDFGLAEATAARVVLAKVLEDFSYPEASETLIKYLYPDAELGDWDSQGESEYITVTIDGESYCFTYSVNVDSISLIDVTTGTVVVDTGELQALVDEFDAANEVPLAVVPMEDETEVTAEPQDEDVPEGAAAVEHRWWKFW